MAKGYPSRIRARKAYWRGLLSSRRPAAINPYQHPHLRDLFEMGREAGLRSPQQVPPATLPGRFHRDQS